MAGSVNKVILVGNLGRDPEVRSFQNGGRVANFSLATSRRWRDGQTGEQRANTEWHRISIYDDKLVEIAEKYLRKGSQVYLEGELQTRKWTDQSGQERYTTEVALPRFRGQMTMLGSRGDAGGFAGGFKYASSVGSWSRSRRSVSSNVVCPMLVARSRIPRTSSMALSDKHSAAATSMNSRKTCTRSLNDSASWFNFRTWKVMILFLICVPKTTINFLRR